MRLVFSHRFSDPQQKCRMESYQKRLNNAILLFNNADAVLVFSGAGMAYHAGLNTYTKLPQGAFYKFAYKYMLIDVNDGFNIESMQDRQNFFRLYAQVFHDNAPSYTAHKQVLDLLHKKPYFIAQTNPDYIYEHSGANAKRIMHIAGFPHYLQCAHACCHTLTPMPEEGSPFPVCPNCGGELRPNLDIFGDDNFIWTQPYLNELHEYSSFVSKYKNKNMLILELECGRHDHFGFNAPVIVSALAQNPNVYVIRINKYEEFNSAGSKYINFYEPISTVLSDLLTAFPRAKRGRPRKQK